MSKLFSLEAIEEEKPDELLIDKLTRLKSTDGEGVSVTVDLIKQRNQLKQEIDNEFKKDDEQDKGNPDDNADPNASADPDGEKPEEGDNPEEGKKPDSSEASDDDTGAEDLDNLNNLVGSAKKSAPATENLTLKPVQSKIRIAHIFNPLKSRYGSYVASLESMNLQSQKKPMGEQPVAYVKEEVLKSLNDLISLAGSYVTNNEEGIKNSTEGIKRLSEQLTIYQQYHDKDKLHFTSKMVSKDDIKTALSVNENSDLRETAGLLAKYFDATVPLVDKLLTNSLEQLPSVLMTSGFKQEADTLDYKNVLPGFYRVSAFLTPFTTYLETNYENYQIFRLKTFKLQDLYKLNHIALTEDKDFLAIMDRANSIIMSIGLSIDNLKTINDSYKSFIDKLKATVYEIEKGEIDKLSDLQLDEKMKDFIKYKLVTEMYSLNISMGNEFLTSLVSAMNILADLDE